MNIRKISQIIAFISGIALLTTGSLYIHLLRKPEEVPLQQQEKEIDKKEEKEREPDDIEEQEIENENSEDIKERNFDFSISSTAGHFEITDDENSLKHIAITSLLDNYRSVGRIKKDIEDSAINISAHIRIEQQKPYDRTQYSKESVANAVIGNVTIPTNIAMFSQSRAYIELNLTKTNIKTLDINATDVSYTVNIKEPSVPERINVVGGRGTVTINIPKSIGFLLNCEETKQEQNYSRGPIFINEERLPDWGECEENLYSDNFNASTPHIIIVPKGSMRVSLDINTY